MPSQVTETGDALVPAMRTASGPDYLYWSYFLLGTGFLTAWNAMLSAVDYFKDIYPDREALRWISVCFFITAVITIVVNSVIPSKDRGHTRVSVGLLLFVIFLSVIPIMDMILVKNEKGTDLSFALLMLTTVMIGIGHALNEGCSFGIVIYLPIKYNQVASQPVHDMESDSDLKGYLRGTGLCGLIVVALRVVTKAALTESADGLRISAWIFFAFSAVFCAICLLAQRCIIIPHAVFQEEAGRDEEQSLLEQETETEPKQAVSLWTRFLENHWVRAISRLRLVGLNLFFIFFVTFIIFPGVPSDGHSEMLGDWYGVILVAWYAVGNYISRQMPKTWTIAEGKKVTAVVFSRFLFIPVVFTAVHYTFNPAIVSVLIFALGLSQGYASMCVFAMGQERMQGKADSFVGGNFLAFCLAAGLSCGSLVSVAWTQID